MAKVCVCVLSAADCWMALVGVAQPVAWCCGYWHQVLKN